MNKRIVVADDESHILHVVCTKLRNAGYDLVTAVDGEEACELCLHECPDLLITDNQMPLLTGMELSRKLRQDARTASLPTIMLTARGFDLTQEELTEAGISMVLAKPFSPRELLERVVSMIGQPQDAPVQTQP